MNKQERLAISEFCETHRSCAACWWPESDARRSLDLHHIIGGAGRKNDVRNFLRLCRRCHEIYHSGKIVGCFESLNKRILLGLKQECDPDNYDPEFLAYLKHKKHLGYEPAQLPDFYLKERERNVGSWTSRTP